ncbi:9392_t:CDS:1, partial [Gigaspora rosea]
MDRGNSNDDGRQNDQNVEFAEDMIDGIKQFTANQDTRPPQPSPSLQETIFLGTS